MARRRRVIRRPELVHDEPTPTTAWKPAAKCPDCKRAPGVRYSEQEVQRARRERQGAHLQEVQCTWCRARYWIRAKDIANAVLDTAPEAA